MTQSGSGRAEQGGRSAHTAHADEVNESRDVLTAGEESSISAAEVETGADPMRVLDRSLVHGLAWTGAMKWVAQALNWAATLLIARILTPEDFGLFGLAMLYLGFVQLVSEFGMGAAIIREHDLTSQQIAGLGALSIALGGLLWALSAVLAIPVAGFFDEPSVRWIISVLGVTFVISGVRVLPRSLMTRDLEFKRVATTDVVESIGYIVVTLTAAMLGARYWSLVMGGIAGNLAGTLLALWWRAHRLEWPKNLRSLATALKFGGHVVAGRISWYLYSNADFAIIGRVVGTAALGAYSIGWNTASIPVHKISALVGQVTPAIFSAVKGDQAALRRYLLRLTEGLAFITFPVSVGIALVADDFVLTVLTEKWQPAILPLRLLAAYAGVRSITTLIPQILNYVGRSRDQMRFSFLALCVLTPMFYIGARVGGTAGVAWAWIIGYPLVILPGLFVAFEITGLTVGSYLAALRPAALGTLGMALAVVAVRPLVPAAWGGVGHLVVETLTGAVVYAGLMYAGYGQRLRDAVRLVRELRT